MLLYDDFKGLIGCLYSLLKTYKEANVFSLWKHQLDTGDQFSLSCHVVLQSY